MALTPDQDAHLRRIKSFAPVAEEGGVSGAVLAAQGTVESNWGRSGLSRKGNAYFGVKARSSWGGKVYSGSTHELINGRSVRFPGHNIVYPSYAAAVGSGANRTALFRAYEDFEENVHDYVRFYQANPRYRPALDAYAARRDPFEFATLIHRAGYATAADYAQTLHRFMRLYCQDLLVAVPEKVTVYIGPAKVPDVAVLVQDGRVYAHLRTIAPLMGADTQWDPKTKTVTLKAVGG